MLHAEKAHDVNILFNQVYEWVIFFEDWDRFKKTGSHTRTKMTLKLPPPPPRINSPFVTSQFMIYWLLDA